MKTQSTRAHSRVTAFIPVMIHTDTGGVIKGEIEDISVGGALIRVVGDLAIGQSIKIELRFAGLKSSLGYVIDPDVIEDEGLIRAEEMAEVRWQRDGIYVGVSFANLSRRTKNFLSHLVKYFEELKREDVV